MIYLDHNATTQVRASVRDAMLPYLTDQWGNPSSTYRFGSRLKTAIEAARAQVAELLGAPHRDVVFTSGATESNNTAVHAALKARPGKRHVITSQVEHSSVLNYCMFLEAEGYRVTYLPVGKDGLLKLADLEGAICKDTALVSLLWANNETGVLFPVAEIADLCRARGVLYHCDAVQAAGKLPICVSTLPVDYLSISGHKFNAPKGVGALYVHRKAPFHPYLHGGHQERGRRGGTENVASIVGIGVAAELAAAGVSTYDQTVRSLRDALEGRILADIRETELNGHPGHRLPNTSNITFRGIESESLLLLLDREDICASSGSACLADSDEPSHVLKAMKPEDATSRQALRFSLGTDNTAEDVSATLAALKAAVKALR